MNTTSRIPLQKRSPLRFLVDGLQVWVTYLDAIGDGPFGVRFEWFETEYDSSPLNHITEDGGFTYKKFERYFMPEGVDMRFGEQETDPEKLNRLQRIWVEYQKKLGEEVFSV